MIKRKLRIREGYLLFVVVVTPLIFSSLFVFSNLRGNLLIERAMKTLSDPLLEPYELKSAITYYYRDVLSALSKAIQLSREDAQLYKYKVRYFKKAQNSGREKELDFDMKADAEELYIKAINLNPTKYYYHLELGQLYLEENRLKEAEKELMKSHSLFPKEIEPLLYLVKYYLELARKEGVMVDEEIFKTLLLAMDIIKYDREKNMWDEMTKMIKEVPAISWDKDSGELKYIAELGDNKFDFKKRKFPHEKIPLTIRLYIKDFAEEIVLYKDNMRYQIFRKIKITPEYNIYEVKLEHFPKEAYLDDFRIETHPSTIIDKIEMIRRRK